MVLDSGGGTLTISLLHRWLGWLGHPVAHSERTAEDFGDATIAAVEQFQARVGIEVTSVVDGPTRAALERAVDGVRRREAFEVRGRVRRRDGSAWAGAEVEAYDLDIRTARLLGSTCADEHGQYQISYPRDRYRDLDRGGPDLVVRVPGDDAGAPLVVWRGEGDSRVRCAYRSDAARRVVEVRESTGGEIDGGAVRERSIYRDQVQGVLPDNSAGRLFAELDGAGSLITRYDFAGNVARLERRVTKAFDVIPEWSAAGTWTDEMPSEVDALLAEEVVAIESSHDAEKRMTAETTPDGRVQQRSYDVAGRLARVWTERGGATEQAVVASVEYDEKGRRAVLTGGHGATTKYHYDPLTFRLRRLETVGGGEQFQDLGYTYDAAGTWCYSYASNGPVRLSDVTGREPDDGEPADHGIGAHVN